MIYSIRRNLEFEEKKHGFARWARSSSCLYKNPESSMQLTTMQSAQCVAPRCSCPSSNQCFETKRT